MNELKKDCTLSRIRIASDHPVVKFQIGWLKITELQNRQISREIIEVFFEKKYFEEVEKDYKARVKTFKGYLEFEQF